jgi:protein involved in polysaccharide export with SLBB domain
LIRFRLLLRPWAALLAAGLLLHPVLGIAQEAVPQLPGGAEAEGLFGATDGFQLEGEGLESAIEGSEYRLGPGDVLVISVWGPQPRAFQLSVTLEGKLLVPAVGEIEVNSLLLSDAKQVIRDAVLRIYRNVEVSVTLVRLRRFQIHVLGQVARPGSYSATGVDRVSAAIDKAGGLTPDANRRMILVENGDSLRTSADLLSFFQLGRIDDNPWLRDGDRVLVSFAKDHVDVRGAVSHPGPVQFLEGDRLSTLLELAGGFTSLSYLDTLEVARYDRYSPIPFNFKVLNGGTLLADDPSRNDLLPQTLGTFHPPNMDLPAGLHPLYPDFDLRPNDIVFVRSVPESRTRWLVDVRGEVVYPGSYPIVEGVTRLSEIIAVAGGLTPDAYIARAQLIRRQAVPLVDPEFERLSKMSPADMEPEEYAYFKVRAREVPGSMVVDFRKALVEQDPRDNVYLFSGDVIDIPTRKDFVSVLGTVWRPGNVNYEPGLTAHQYLQRAGGFADDADKGKSRVIKASGEWVKLGDAGEMEPGDIVFVPEKPDRPFWPVFFQFLTVTYQIVAIYAIVDNASK